MVKRLSVFFGNNALSIAEMDNQSIVKFASIPHNLFDLTGPRQGKDAPEDIRLIAAIQKTLREQKFTTTETYLSLPTKDIIFRSFVIPWVYPGEVKNVVEFEARKYIPFKLEEVSYTFHTSIFNEKSVRKIRVFFVAIRQDILDKYCNILEQANLKISFLEPASVSLIRALVSKNKIPLNQKIALLETNKREGKIIIMDQGIPQFIRDFKLLSANLPKADNDHALFNLKLFNEIRISLDYYARQYTQGKVSTIILVSEKESPELVQTISKDLGIPTSSLGVDAILGTEDAFNIEFLNAYGIGLKDTVNLAVKFDLAQKSIKAQKSEFRFELSKENLLALVKVGGVCLTLIVLSFFGSNFLLMDMQKKISELDSQQGILRDLGLEQINQKTEETRKKIDGYQSVRLKTSTAFFLTKIALVLPKGVWIQEISLRYLDPTKAEFNASKGISNAEETEPDKILHKMNLTLSGLAFDSNANQQIKLVYNLVKSLKDNTLFSTTFDDIKLASAQPSQVEQYTVTSFKIECQ